MNIAESRRLLYLKLCKMLPYETPRRICLAINHIRDDQLRHVLHVLEQENPRVFLSNHYNAAVGRIVEIAEEMPLDNNQSAFGDPSDDNNNVYLVFDCEIVKEKPKITVQTRSFCELRFESGSYNLFPEQIVSDEHGNVGIIPMGELIRHYPARKMESAANERQE